MHNEANVQLLQDIYVAWRSKDPEKVASYFADDCTYEDMAMGAIMNGRAEVLAFAQEVYGTMPDFSVRYTKVFATDTHGSGQWVITATWSGEYEGVDCTGKPVEFTGLSYYEFADGKVAKAQDCWDSVQMMQAFGVVSESLTALGNS